MPQMIDNLRKTHDIKFIFNVYIMKMTYSSLSETIRCLFVFSYPDKTGGYQLVTADYCLP